MRDINKSVFIEALQFNGRNLSEIEEFCECSNVMSVTILNNVLYCIVQSNDKADAVHLIVMPNWIPFNYNK
jgi:hypothetical protein